MSAFALPVELDRLVEEKSQLRDRSGYVGRASFEPCRCPSCIALDPSRAVARARVFPTERTSCPRCGVKRGLRGRLCWKCAPKGT